MSARLALLTVLSACLAFPAQSAEPLIATAPALTRNVNSNVTPVDEAFAFNAVVEADGDVILMWEMPSGYYLYRKTLKIEHAAADLLPMLELPGGQVVTDEFFGASEVYFGRLLARLPAAALNAAPGAIIELQLTYQGCLQDIYCYPPHHRSARIALP